MSADFVMSQELECLTVLPEGAGLAERAVARFFEILGSLAPTLRATAGIFNGYGRVYVDCGHIELAACECDSPYQLPLVLERQQALAAKAVAQLEQEGLPLLLANNNHSGLLQTGCPVWGSHENYLTERHPSQFGDLILPFLVTRIFGGAGGIEYPSGAFFAAVRPLCMVQATGGGTMDCRAIHSTSREEHHMGPSPKRFRYHLILGDGHRSQFNLALQFGATALALKATFFDRRLPAELAKLRGLGKRNWVQTLQGLNVLARPGQPLAIDPRVLATQRVYLAAARRYADSLKRAPGWLERTLRDWDATLVALQRLDRPWLAARLDAFTKYELYSAVLREQGLTWQDLPRRPPLFHELALLDHSYHDFCNPRSVFSRLEQNGVLDHRVGQRVEPGGEPEPFVPPTSTRAGARARFVRQHAGCADFVLDWSCVYDHRLARQRMITDPLAQDFDPWMPFSPEADAWSAWQLATRSVLTIRRNRESG